MLPSNTTDKDKANDFRRWIQSHHFWNKEKINEKHAAGNVDRLVYKMALGKNFFCSPRFSLQGHSARLSSCEFLHAQACATELQSLQPVIIS